MKKYLIAKILFTMLIMQYQVKAQSGKYGIFLSSDDYTHHKLSYGMDSISKNNKLVLHPSTGASTICVITNGKKNVFKKKDIFGYRTNGKDYRVVNGEAFTIVDTLDFFVYSKIIELPLLKWHTEKATCYYFSNSINSAIEPLTKANIENTFTYNQQFELYLNASFKTDQELMAYDKRVKKYKLKYLYEQFLKP